MGVWRRSSQPPPTPGPANPPPPPWLSAGLPGPCADPPRCPPGTVLGFICLPGWLSHSFESSPLDDETVTCLSFSLTAFKMRDLVYSRHWTNTCSLQAQLEASTDLQREGRSPSKKGLAFRAVGTRGLFAHQPREDRFVSFPHLRSGCSSVYLPAVCS